MTPSARLGTRLFATLASALLAGQVLAQTPAAEPPKAPEPDYTLTGNFGIYSQYIFRGLTQTDAKPAAQGGFDYANKNGLYVGTWLSNISWLSDSGACAHGCSLEWDAYGGWKYAFNDDWGMDLGLYFYGYPGKYNPGFTNPNTLEVYVAGSWKWVSLKYSYSVDHTFGVPDNAWYLDLSANYPINDSWTFNAHVGRQEYLGSQNGVSNSVFNYTDWKLGLTYAASGGWNFGAFWSDTNANDSVYTLAGKNIGRSTGTVFVQKTF
ncbi:MAG TPA: TorF family putative porin [Casimicrobiaceae bacterium]|nr:TorF family putative porin [Casimicrobiaceae bacterium]